MPFPRPSLLSALRALPTALAVGCGGAPLDSAGTAPGAWAPEVGDDDAAPPLDAAATARAVREAFLAARYWSAAPVFDLWEQAMAHADAECPGETRAGPLRAWVAECTTAAGAHYSGYGYLEEPPGGFARAWWGSARVTTPEGTPLRLGGRAELQQEPGTSLPALSVVHGTFAGAVADTGEAWVGEGLAVDLELRRARDAMGTASLELRGGASGLALAEGARTAVQFDARLDRPPPGRTPEPSGRVSLRDPAGRWVDVIFQAPALPDPAAPVEAYDGCGTVEDRPVCVDVSGVLEEAW